MSSLLRIFWLITLLFFVSGCSGYQTACFVRSEEPLDPGQDVEQICDLKPGDKVRVILVDGEQAEGVVQIISSSEIVLEAQGNNLQPRGFSIDQVYSIETGSTGGGNSTTTTLLVVGGLVLIVGAVILANEMSDLNNMFEQ